MPAADWWRMHRRQFSNAYWWAFVVAFLIYDLVWDRRIILVYPLLDLAILAAGIGLPLGMAWVIYHMAPRLEERLRPLDINRFRRIIYLLIFWGSCALPFLLPALGHYVRKHDPRLDSFKLHYSGKIYIVPSYEQ